MCKTVVLSVCETLSFALRDGLRAFQNKVLIRTELVIGLRKLMDEEINNSCSSPNTFAAIYVKSRRKPQEIRLEREADN